MNIFGPVPSRRLGKSLGINIIPPGYCSYSCIYCQLGRTSKMRIKPLEITEIDRLKKDVGEGITELKARGEGIDYLTFVADGEPTLAAHLGKLIEELKIYGIKIAVITNGSLFWDAGIRQDLNKADWVSVKCDSVNEDTWRKIDRPHRLLKLARIKEGIMEFSRGFKGFLAAETMLVEGVNTTAYEMEQTAGFLAELSPAAAYLSIPTRPPAEGYVQPPSYEFINQAYKIFRDRNLQVEYLIGYEGNEFSSTGDIEKDILSITAVHPLKKEAVRELLRKNKQGWERVEKLIIEEQIIETEFKDEKYYLRAFR